MLENFFLVFAGSPAQNSIKSTLFRNVSFFLQIFFLSHGFANIHQCLFRADTNSDNCPPLQFQNKAISNIPLNCTFDTMKQKLQFFEQHGRFQRIRCKAEDFMILFVDLRGYKEVFALFRRFLQAFVVYLSEFLFNVSHFCFCSTFCA